MEGIDYKQAFDVFCYVSDSSQFYNRHTKKPIKEVSLRKRICDMYPELETRGKVLDDVVHTLKRFAFSEKDLGVEKKGKSNKKQINRQLYADVKDALPMRWMASVSGEDRLYYVNSNNEVTFAGQTTKDNFNTVVRGAENGLLSRLYNVYTDSDICRELQKKGQIAKFEQYLEIIFNEFRFDPNYRLEKDPPIITHHPTDLAYKRFDPSQLQKGPTPHWDEFLTRINYPEIFMAWVWSVFEPKNKGRQLLWLQGRGNDGKSTVIQVITDYLGKNHTAAIQENTGSQFFFSNVYGKRLATFGDCKSPRYIASSKIHSLVAGDYVSIERKGEQPFSEYVQLRLMIGSNFFPQIDFSMPNEHTRLILLKVEQPEDLSGDINFKDALMAEKKEFLYRCREMYEKHCPKDAQISCPPELIEEMRDDAESKESSFVIDFIDKYIEFDSESKIKTEELEEVFDTRARMRGFGAEKSARMMRDLEAQLKDKGVKRSRRRFTIDGKQTTRKAFGGIKLKAGIL